MIPQAKQSKEKKADFRDVPTVLYHKGKAREWQSLRFL